MQTTSKLFVPFLCCLTLLLVSGCGNKQTASESEFLKRCPEVPLEKIPRNIRAAFMTPYESTRPKLEGSDVVMLASEQEIAEIEKTHKVEKLGDKSVGDSGMKMPEIRIKNAGAAYHEKIVKSYCDSFVPSFLAAARR